MKEIQVAIVEDEEEAREKLLSFLKKLGEEEDLFELNPELYVRWVLENVPKMETDGFPYDDYLPWSEKIPDWVRSHDPVKN